MTGDNAAVHLRICAANGGRWWALDFEGYLAAIYRWLLRPGMVVAPAQKRGSMVVMGWPRFDGFLEEWFGLK